MTRVLHHLSDCQSSTKRKSACREGKAEPQQSSGRKKRSKKGVEENENGICHRSSTMSKHISILGCSGLLIENRQLASVTTILAWPVFGASVTHTPAAE